MRTKEKTIILAKIRRLIRDAIKWYKIDDGMPNFWSSENYKCTKKLLSYNMQDRTKNYPYYTRSDVAIREIAEKIYNLVEGGK